jgi:hypothetical protein
MNMEPLQGYLAAIGGLAVVVAYGMYLMHQSAKARSNKPKPSVVDCPDCKGKVSTKVAACPHCGRPMG